MTKYILHGGATIRKTEDNNKFFKEIISGSVNPINLLIICFAKNKDIWDEVFENTKITFSSVSPEKQIDFTLADDNINVLKKQITSADAIYMLGGETGKLRDILIKIDDLEKLWAGKVIAGSSAGALVLSKYFYENDVDTYHKGLGILPFKLFCHYSKEKSDKLGKLEKFADNNLEVHTIQEEENFVFEK